MMQIIHFFPRSTPGPRRTQASNSRYAITAPGGTTLPVIHALTVLGNTSMRRANSAPERSHSAMSFGKSEYRPGVLLVFRVPERISHRVSAAITLDLPQRDTPRSICVLSTI